MERIEADADGEELSNKMTALQQFLREFEKGNYYANAVVGVASKVQEEPSLFVDETEYEKRARADRREVALVDYRDNLIAQREEIIGLIIELTHFQDWDANTDYFRLHPGASRAS